ASGPRAPDPAGRLRQAPHGRAHDHARVQRDRAEAPARHRRGGLTSMNRKKLMRVLPWIVTPALVVVIIAGWHFIVTLGNVNPFLFPPPSAVGEKFVGLLQ